MLDSSQIVDSILEFAGTFLLNGKTTFFFEKNGEGYELQVKKAGEPETQPSSETGYWLRPAGAQRNSYRYKCSKCGHIVYQVTGNNGKKIQAKNPPCTYPSCPYCKVDMIIPGPFEG